MATRAWSLPPLLSGRWRAAFDIRRAATRAVKHKSIVGSIRRPRAFVFQNIDMEQKICRVRRVR